MSQILDAIKQADEKRKGANNSKNRVDNPYQYLTPKTNNKKRTILWLSVALFAALALIASKLYQPKNTVAPAIKQKQTIAQTKQTPSETKTSKASTAAVPSKNTETEASGSNVIPATESDSTQNNTLALEIPEDGETATTFAKSDPIGKEPDPLLADIPKAKPTKAVSVTPSKKPASTNTQHPVKQQSKQQPKVVSTPPEVDNSTAAWKQNLTISAIFNHDSPAKRFVLISGKKLKEGDPIPNHDLKLVKIMSNGIIVSGKNGQTLIKTH